MINLIKNIKYSQKLKKNWIEGKKEKKNIKVKKKKLNNLTFSKFKIKYSLSVQQKLQLLYKQFIKKGKNKGYFFILNLIKFSKEKWKQLPNKPYQNIPNIILKAKFSMILKNKRRGSVIYELPRCLGKIQNIRKTYYWFVKLTKKRKKKTLNNMILELKNIKNKKGELIKKRSLMKIIAKKNKPFFYLLKKKKKKKKLKR